MLHYDYDAINWLPMCHNTRERYASMLVMLFGVQRVKSFKLMFPKYYCCVISVYDRLRAVLREQLIKSGWRDALKMECRRVVQEQGLDNISVDEIIKQVTPHARGSRSKFIFSVRHLWNNSSFVFHHWQPLFLTTWSKICCSASERLSSRNRNRCDVMDFSRVFSPQISSVVCRVFSMKIEYKHLWSFWIEKCFSRRMVCRWGAE